MGKQKILKKISKNFEKPLDKSIQMWYNKYRKGTGLNLDCGNLVKSIRNEISTRDMP